MANINNTVLDMSAIILGGLTADKDLGTVTAAEDTFEKTLPSDLTMEVVNKVQNHNTTFVAAATHAFGTVAMNAMKENAKLDTVIGTINMGGDDTLGMHYTRSKEMHVPGKDEKVTKYGVTTIDYTVKAGKNGGELKKVRTELNELALAAFGK